ncbi:MAG: DivIVA domain-containing protein [Gaiella sp.]
MSITPVEIRHLVLKRGLLGGFKRAGVQRAMDDIADSFETVWRERAELGERVEALETELNRHVELEGLLRSTLVSAERAAQDIREQARREADVIISEAHAESRKLMRDALAEREALTVDSQHIRAMLHAALGLLNEPRPTVESVAREGTETGLEDALQELEEAVETPGPVPVTAASGDSADTTPGFRRLAG